MKREYSLKKSHDIAKVIRSKQSVGNRYYAIYYQENDIGKPQIAISVSKKVGNAVTRNYQKRVIREVVRRDLDNLPPYSYLIVVKKNSLYLEFQEKQKQLEYLLNKIKMHPKGVKHEKK